MTTMTWLKSIVNFAMFIERIFQIRWCKTDVVWQTNIRDKVRSCLLNVTNKLVQKIKKQFQENYWFTISQFRSGVLQTKEMITETLSHQMTQNAVDGGVASLSINFLKFVCIRAFQMMRLDIIEGKFSQLNTDIFLCPKNTNFKYQKSHNQLILE